MHIAKDEGKIHNLTGALIHDLRGAEWTVSGPNLFRTAFKAELVLDAQQWAAWFRAAISN